MLELLKNIGVIIVAALMTGWFLAGVHEAVTHYLNKKED